MFLEPPEIGQHFRRKKATLKGHYSAMLFGSLGLIYTNNMGIFPTELPINYIYYKGGGVGVGRREIYVSHS